MPIIRCTLTVDSLDKAIAEVKAYGDKVRQAETVIVKRLAEDGAKQAQDLVAYMNAVDTGELMGSITHEESGNTGKIIAGAEHAAYVEFGTGVVGAGSPHPNPVGWAYDINGHGEAGWIYKGDDGHLHWTRGMASRPYMYDTAQMLAEAVPQIAEEALGV